MSFINVEDVQIYNFLRAVNINTMKFANFGFDIFIHTNIRYTYSAADNNYKCGLKLLFAGEMSWTSLSHFITLVTSSSLMH